MDTENDNGIQDRDPRSPAQLRVLMDVCGITAEDMATQLGVSRRSVRRWRHMAPAPADAWAIVDAQVAWMLDTVEAVIDELDELDEAEDAPVHLSVYADDVSASSAGVTMGTRWHAAAIGVLAIVLQLDGRDVTISEVPRET